MIALNKRSLWLVPVMLGALIASAAAESPRERRDRFVNPTPKTQPAPTVDTSRWGTAGTQVGQPQWGTVGGAGQTASTPRPPGQ